MDNFDIHQWQAQFRRQSQLLNEVKEATEMEDRIESLINRKNYNDLIRLTRIIYSDLKSEGFEDVDIYGFLIKRMQQGKYIAEGEAINEDNNPAKILATLKKYAEAFEEKLYNYSDKELVSIKNTLEDLLPHSATDADKLIQNIADFIEDVLNVADQIEDPFPVLEKLEDLELFDFYSEFENIVRDLIEHIEGNVMYDRSHSASGVDEGMSPKKLTDLKLGEKFFVNDDYYQFIELGELPNTAKVKILPGGRTSVVSFGGGTVNKKTKPGFATYLAGGGREWD